MILDEVNAPAGIAAAPAGAAPAPCATRSRWLVALQFGLIGLAPLPGLVPPASGALLIVPVRSRPLGDTINWAAARGARLLGPGPSAGSITVHGSRTALLGPALAHGALLLNGRNGCNSIVSE